MHTVPRITVEVPVLGVGSGPSDYEGLGSHVRVLRKPRGLHMTLLHLGVLDEFAQDVSDWTKGITSADAAARNAVAWLDGLTVLGGFSGSAERLITLGGGNVTGLEVKVPEHVQEYQVFLVQGLHELLDGLLVDNVDDFILSSRALGFRSPHWLPHVAVGSPWTRGAGALEIEPLTIEFGESRVRNRQLLPGDGLVPAPPVRTPEP